MFESKTLFVVGAGASTDFGFPVGAALKERIADLLDIRYEDGHSQSAGDRYIADALIRHANRTRNLYNNYLDACWSIRNAMPQAISIDNYVDAHNDDERFALCAKLAITRAILDYEANSALKVEAINSTIDFASVDDNWLNYFWQVASEGVRRPDFERLFDNVSFIVFNYDRCIEQYLIHAVSNYYRVSMFEAMELVAKIKIIHPYGTVGNIFGKGREGVPYGMQVGGSSILEISGGIKTFTESIDDPAFMSAIHEEVSTAETIVFLGFAYFPQNMRLLTPPSACSTQRVLGTSYGLSKSDTEHIMRDIDGSLPSRPGGFIELKPMKCGQLFTEYRRTLASAA